MTIQPFETTLSTYFTRSPKIEIRKPNPKAVQQQATFVNEVRLYTPIFMTSSTGG